MILKEKTELISINLFMFDATLEKHATTNHLIEFIKAIQSPLNPFSM